jgi:hypothetical protein
MILLAVVISSPLVLGVISNAYAAELTVPHPPTKIDSSQARIDGVTLFSNNLPHMLQ